MAWKCNPITSIWCIHGLEWGSANSWCLKKPSISIDGFAMRSEMRTNDVGKRRKCSSSATPSLWKRNTTGIRMSSSTLLSPDIANGGEPSALLPIMSSSKSHRNSYHRSSYRVFQLMPLFDTSAIVVPCTMPPSQNRKYLLTHMLLLTNISTNYSVRNNHIHTHYDYRSSIIIPGIYRC